jgi:hypothetical protein
MNLRGGILDTSGPAGTMGGSDTLRSRYIGLGWNRALGDALEVRAGTRWNWAMGQRWRLSGDAEVIRPLAIAGGNRRPSHAGAGRALCTARSADPHTRAIASMLVPITAGRRSA